MSNYKVYTSYYANVKSCIRPEYLFIRVSNSVPYWFEPRLIELQTRVYPSWDIVNGIHKGIITEELFVERYLSSLSKLNKASIIEEIDSLVDITGASVVVLLCWEGKQSFCHRKPLAKWLYGNDYAGEL